MSRLSQDRGNAGRPSSASSLRVTNRAARRAAAFALFVFALVLVALAPLRPSSAQRLHSLSVTVGETGALVDTAALAPTLREALVGEVSGHPRLRLSSPRFAHVVLRGSVTRLERRALGVRGHVRCEVSLVVADRRGGAVRAMLRGSASAQGAPGGALDQAVIRAAVKGALRSLGPDVARGRR